MFVSSQSGYWKLQGGRQKYSVWAFTHLVFPLVTRVCGYLPWSRLASGEDLPSGVALQWASWCRSKNYLFDDTTLGDFSGYESFSRPLLAYCVSDDDWGTRAAVQALTERYSSAQIEYREITPQQFGLTSLGHMGFFKSGCEAIWQDTLAWIDQH